MRDGRREGGGSTHRGIRMRTGGGVYIWRKGQRGGGGEENGEGRADDTRKGAGPRHWVRGGQSGRQ